MRKSVAAAVLAASFGSTHAAVARAGTCNENNCLRALANKDRVASAYAFCTSFLSTSVPATATAGLPSYVANCGPSYISNLSSACPCFLATATYRPSSTPSSSTVCSTPTSTSTRGCTGYGSQPPPTCPTSVSTVTITAPGTGSTCPPPATSTFTLTVSGSGTCPPPSTVTGPPTTTTASCPSCPPPTTVTAPPTTVTEPPTTVTEQPSCPPPSTTTSTTTRTITTTAGPTPSTCDRPLANPSFFSSQNGGTDPWQFAGNGVVPFLAGCLPPGNPFDPNCPPGGTFSDGTSFGIRFPSSSPPSSFLRFWQGFTPCAVSSTYRTSIYVNSDNAAVAFTLTLRIYLQNVSGFGTTLALTSTRTVSGIGWQQVSFDTFTSDFSTAMLYLDVTSPSTRASDARLWLDDFVANKIS